LQLDDIHWGRPLVLPHDPNRVFEHCGDSV
jgi:hypothetical protein